MIKHYFTIAYRNLLRNKLFSIIQITGFSLGLAAFIIGAQTVIFEYSYDDFVPNSEHVLTVQTMNRVPVTRLWAGSPAPLKEAIESEIPEIEYVSRYFTNTEDAYCVIVYNAPDGTKKKFNEPLAKYVDEDFLKILQYPMISGNREEALGGPTSIVMTASVARKYFGDDDPIGKVVELSTGNTESKKTQFTYTVMAVLNDLPANSTLEFEILLPFQNFENHFNQDLKTIWDWDAYQTFCLAKDPNIDLATLATKIHSLIPEDYNPLQENEQKDVLVKPMEELHFTHNPEDPYHTSSNRKRTTQIIGLIGIILLVIAGVNYINLKTARALKRQKEVGIRKVVGANRAQLINQFLSESFLINMLALGIAVTMVQLARPGIYMLTGFEIPRFSWGSYHTIWLLVIVTICSVAFGIIPALFVTKSHFISALKGTMATKRNHPLRKSLVVFQFFASAIFIIFAFAVNQQISMLQNTKRGFEIENRLIIDAVGTQDFDFKKFRAFKNRVLTHKNVLNLTAASALPKVSGGGLAIISLPNNPDEKLRFMRCEFDFDMVSTMGIRLLAGRDFTNERMTDEKVVIISNKAAKKLGYENPTEAIGKTLIYNWIEYKMNLKIVGVVDDVKFDPGGAYNVGLEFFFLADNAYPYPKYKSYVVHINESKKDQTIAYLSKEWAKVFPDAPFQYSFMEDKAEMSFEDHKQSQAVIQVSASMAIFIAALGLLGLVTFETNTRTKEIGIRKALGSSLQQMLMLLSKNYMKLILISMILATPLAWYSIDQFLSNYQLQITLDLWTFVIPCLALVVFALMVIMMMTFKAANSNPVDSLRDE